jgi:hypothetical protein
MSPRTRERVLPMLSQQDLVMGLNFFTQDRLLEMLMEVDIEELVRVILEAFPMEEIVGMFSEEDLAGFFMHKELERFDVMEQLKVLPPDYMQKFIEGVTGMPYEQSKPEEIFNMISNLPDDQFKKFMASIDPDVQRQLTFQLTTDKPEYLTLFKNETYVKMLNKLIKPEMIKPMIMLNKESLVGMISELPPDLMSVVAAQVDEKALAKLLQAGHMDLLKDVWMI